MAEFVFPSRPRRRQSVLVALVVSDVLMLGAATLSASLIWFGRVAHITAVLDRGRVITFADLSVVIVALWVGSLYLEHLYDLDRVFWGTGEYARVVRGLSTGVIAFIVATYLLKVPALSRGWIMLAWGLGIVLVALGRFVIRVALAHAHGRGAMRRPALIIGANSEATDIINALRANPSSGLTPIGCLAGDRAEGRDGCAGVPCLGEASDLERVLDERFVDTVVIASTAFDHDRLAGIINRLRGRDIDIQMSSGLLHVTSARARVREVSGIPLITIRAVSFSAAKVLIKRSFDLVVGGAIALVGIPIWLLIALGIKMESRGPVLYRQERVGRGGATFLMYKFRSMCDDADAKRNELAQHNEATGPLFKIKDDPRVTRVGRFLRRYSLDEFPQLINVLRGEMSLVGPRPALPDEVAQYTENHARRLEVLPGMTGLWQVSGRSGLTFDEMVRLDLFYIENWSVGFDLALMLRTVPTVLLPEGAY